MVTDVPVTVETRRALVRHVLEELAEGVEAAVEQVNGGPWDGVPVITEKNWIGQLAAALGRPIPPTPENSAELGTPATIYFQAVCPKCGGRSAIKLEVHTELTIDWHSAQLKLKGKSKPVTHICGQTTIDEAVEKDEGEQGDFELTDIVGDQVTVEHWHESLDGQGDRLSHAHDGGHEKHDHEADGWAEAGYSVGTTDELTPVDVTPIEGQGIVEEVENAEESIAAEAADILLAGEAEATPEEPCPYPGCIRPADHRGRHKVPKAEGEVSADEGDEQPD